ncbi:hypothetical protein ACFLZ8_05025 [Planctomycetota bacterium]
MKTRLFLETVILALVALLSFAGCNTNQPEVATQSDTTLSSQEKVAAAAPEAPSQSQAAMVAPRMPPEGGPGGAGPAQTTTYRIDIFFTVIDSNYDGLRSKEEFDSVGLTDRFFIFCDPDGDEHISKEEMIACALPVDVDMNKDGMLMVEEVVEFEATPLGRERGPGEEVPD